MPMLVNIATLHPKTVTNAEDAAKAHKPRRSRTKPEPEPEVTQIRVHPEVWERAKQIAGGDYKRMVIESETSVLVKN